MANSSEGPLDDTPVLLWRIDNGGTGQGDRRFVHSPASLRDLPTDMATIIYLPGKSASHEKVLAPSANFEILDIHIGSVIDMLGSDVRLGQDVALVAATYMSDTDPVAYAKAMITQESGQTNPTSVAAATLASDLLGNVEDYEKIPEARRAMAVDDIAKTLRTKVFFCSSIGTLQADYIANAMVRELEQRHYPPDVICKEIMPNMKVAGWMEFGLPLRPTGHQPTGVTFVSVVNGVDKIFDKKDIRKLGIRPVEGFGQGRGTVLAQINENEAVLMLTLPRHAEMHVPYDMKTHFLGQRGCIGFVTRENELLAVIEYSDHNGHSPRSFVTPLIPLDGQQAGLSLTEVTCNAPANILRGMIHDAMKAAQHGAEISPIASPVEYIITPSPAVGAVVHDPLYMQMLVSGYQQHLESVYVPGIHPLSAVIQGLLVSQTPLAQQALNVIAAHDTGMTGLNGEPVLCAEETGYILEATLRQAGRSYHPLIAETPEQFAEALQQFSDPEWQASQAGATDPNAPHIAIVIKSGRIPERK